MVRVEPGPGGNAPVVILEDPIDSLAKKEFS